MKPVFAILLAFSTLSSPSSRASESSDQLRDALEFLRGRVEIQRLDHTKYVKTTGLVIGATGLIPIALAPWTDSHPEASVIRGAYVFPGLAIIVTGLAINVAGQLYPILKTRFIGDDAERFANEKNIQYFFRLSPARQYLLANRHPALRSFVIDLAEFYGFVARPAASPANGAAHSAT